MQARPGIESTRLWSLIPPPARRSKAFEGPRYRGTRLAPERGLEPADLRARPAHPPDGRVRRGRRVLLERGTLDAARARHGRVRGGLRRPGVYLRGILHPTGHTEGARPRGSRDEEGREDGSIRRSPGDLRGNARRNNRARQRSDAPQGDL